VDQVMSRKSHVGSNPTPAPGRSRLCHVLRWQLHSAAVALMLSVVLQEGAVLQDVGGVRRLPGQRQEVSVTSLKVTN
jgi:hypothetical protein